MDRRTFLKAVSGTIAATTVPNSVTANTGHDGDTESVSLEMTGHSLLSNPEGAYAEGSVREDGKYAAIGGYGGESGSFLVDLSDLDEPEEVHHLEKAGGVYHLDVKFDARDGLYYRTLESFTDGGIQIVDYGWEDGEPEEPKIIAEMDAGPTHNIDLHDDENVLYAVNAYGDGGVDVYDVSDPHNPVEISFDDSTEQPDELWTHSNHTKGLEHPAQLMHPDDKDDGTGGTVHDVVIDESRDLAHVAVIGGEHEGYQLYDISDPQNPEPSGHFGYDGRPDYEEIGIPGFESAHYALADPDRELAFVGDEVGPGTPGGKHVLDISDPENPVHKGFTHSPNAEHQGDDEGESRFSWTGHNFDPVPGQELLVSGDYAEGVVLYDTSDPEHPQPIDRFKTDLTEDDSETLPDAWSAVYNEARGFVLASDMGTGVYTLTLE